MNHTITELGYRLFGKHLYRRYELYGFKDVALEVASNLRYNGIHARVVETTKGWEVWSTE